MKNLIVLLALALITTTSSAVNAGSPQQCKTTLAHVLVQVGMKSSKPFWELSNQEILEFKQRAKAAGLWTQFAQVCNSWSAEQCRGCTCGRNFSNTACSPNCGCCWGDERCPLKF